MIYPLKKLEYLSSYVEVLLVKRVAGAENGKVHVGEQSLGDPEVGGGLREPLGEPGAGFGKDAVRESGNHEDEKSRRTLIAGQFLHQPVL